MLFVSAEFYEDQVAEIVVTVEKKAVVSVDPALPRKFSDVLGADR